MMKIKALIFLLWCCALFCCLMQLAAATQELDIDTIVAGLKNYDKMIQSGEADITFKTSQYDRQDKQIDSSISERHIIFDSHSTLLEFKESRNIHIPKKTILAKKNGVLTVFRYPRHGDICMFQSFPSHPEVMESDPRHLTAGMFNHIAKRNFSIRSKEILDEVLCYVLEAQENQRRERAWVSPERGFGYLKSEKWSMPKAIQSREFEREMPEVSRQRISY